jgi:hypothetical protein
MGPVYRCSLETPTGPRISSSICLWLPLKRLSAETRTVLYKRSRVLSPHKTEPNKYRAG